MAVIRVKLPVHLRTLARINGEIRIDVEFPVTQKTLIDALENTYPVLRGTIRDRDTGGRRAYLRFFADRRDLSHEPADSPLPDSVVSGTEPFLIIGAVAGG